MTGENQLVPQQESRAAMDPAALKDRLVEEKERRALMRGFIASELKENVDYGTIPGVRSSKPCLFKPGAEKFCSLLQLRAEFAKDQETLDMAGGKEGLIAYVCRLIHNPTGQVVAEGRGACSVGEKQGNVNTTIKIAEKRAMIDAVLRLGLSESYTQDVIEDDLSAALAPIPYPVPTTAAGNPRGSITEPQMRMVYGLLHQIGASKEQADEFAQKQFGVRLSGLTIDQGKKLIDALQKRAEKGSTPPDAQNGAGSVPTQPNGSEAVPGGGAGAPAKPEATAEAPRGDRMAVITEYRQAAAAAKGLVELDQLDGTAKLDKRVIGNRLLEAAVQGIIKDREKELAA